jgi:hypothetical protein
MNPIISEIIIGHAVSLAGACLPYAVRDVDGVDTGHARMFHVLAGHRFACTFLLIALLLLPERRASNATMVWFNQHSSITCVVSSTTWGGTHFPTFPAGYLAVNGTIKGVAL